MRTIFAILFFVTVCLTACSQFNKANDKQNTVNEFTPNPAAYQLFPTKNMWTFIKLNTRNGQMWQVQFDVQADNRFETYLSLEPLVTTENEANGRFTLYPTQNTYNFILLDQLDGKTWQVQWSMEAENRGIISIN